MLFLIGGDSKPNHCGTAMYGRSWGRLGSALAAEARQFVLQ